MLLLKLKLKLKLMLMLMLMLKLVLGFRNNMGSSLWYFTSLHFTLFHFSNCRNLLSYHISLCHFTPSSGLLYNVRCHIAILCADKTSVRHCMTSNQMCQYSLLPSFSSFILSSPPFYFFFCFFLHDTLSFLPSFFLSPPFLFQTW